MPPPELRFALNHMVAPRLDPEAFFALAPRAGRARGGDPQRPRRQRHPRRHAGGGGSARCAAAAGVRILSINALQRFDDWRRRGRPRRLTLADYARACGAEALVLVPSNDGAPARPAACAALEGLRRDPGAARAARPGRAAGLRDLGAAPQVRGGRGDRRRARAATSSAWCTTPSTTTWPARRRSSRPDRPRAHLGRGRPGPGVAAMRDADRVLVTPADRIGNIAQIQALLAGGYAGYLSFEPFAPQVQALAAPGRGAPAEHGPDQRRA